MEQSSPQFSDFLLSLPAFLIALVVHEYAHGYVANKLGDNTAKQMGRLTFNPLAHIDPMGTIFLPLFLILTRAPFIFGWAKPVPVNFSNLRNPKKHMIWVGLAGPAANFALAILIFLLLSLKIPGIPVFSAFLVNVMIINIFLGAFNLIPIPPLDGSRILMGLLPHRLSIAYSRLERYGIIILMMFLLLIRRFIL